MSKLYQFFSEQFPTRAYHVAGYVAAFRSGYFATENKVLADALTLKAEEWGIVPDPHNPKESTSPEMAVPERAPGAVPGSGLTVAEVEQAAPRRPHEVEMAVPEVPPPAHIPKRLKVKR